MARQEKEKVTLQIEEGTLGIRNATCPNGCDLMDPGVLIHDLPSIRVAYEAEGKKGSVHLDPLYGRFESVHDWDPPLGEIVEFLCPRCGESLRSDEGTCRICAAPLFALQLKSGIVEGCLRRGCLYHRMTIVGSDELMQRLFDDRSQDSYL
ncbi:MAG: hypothetical protein GF346_05550 [Candidatus Eisenbacteria bacterium]|nr:hypothetical protein [Candidatus Latescibacterota bacterium]MBD3301893.1 hypothetical protein [Candidatus Eisenbacteria bacterium]